MPQPLTLAIAAVRTALTYAVVALYTILVGPPGIALALMFKRPNVLFQLGAGGAWLLLRTAGVWFRAEGPGHVLLDRAAVYASNHTSNIEPPVIFLVLRGLFPRWRIIYKASLRRLPILGRCFDIGGFVPIERSNREQSGRAIANAARQMRDGNSFSVFVEGTRSRTGELLPFKKGGFILAIEAQAPIVPVAFVGAREAWPPGSRLIRRRTVSVRIGLPVETTGLTYADRDWLMDEVRRRISALIATVGEAQSSER